MEKPSYFIYNRLDLIIPPANPKPVKTRAKKKLSRKVVSSLKNFLDLPLDILYETFAYLEPLDLLNLSRLSKDFRALFLSRSSLSIWRRVLKNVPNLPPCPQDLCEPQYASLMFEKFCMACGSNRGSIEAYPSARLRFCATCAKTNLIRGYTLRTKHKIETVRKATTIIPFATVDSYIALEGMPDDYSSTQNQLGSCYFKPELERALDALEGRHEDFVVEQQLIATRMIQEGRTMEAYNEDTANEQEELLEEIISRRYQRIKQEMKALGWNTDLYTPEYGEEDARKWEEYLFQHKEFSMRSWQSIRPKLAEIYYRTRRSRLVEDLIRRAWGEYVSFRERQTPEIRRTLPPWADVCQSDFLAEFCAENHEECDAQTMEDLMVKIVGIAPAFAARVEHELAHVIERVDSTQKLLCNGVITSNTASSSSTARIIDTKDNGKGKAKADANQEKSAQEILGLAANVFLCQCYLCSDKRSGSTRAFTFPDVVNHVVDNATIARSWSQLKPRTSMEGINAARDVLVALNLPEDATVTEVLALGDLVCGCGHYRFEGPLTYDRLVTHVYEQQMWKRYIVKNVDSGSEHLVDDFVVDGHSREHLKGLVRVSVDDERATPSKGSAASGNETTSTDTDSAGAPDEPVSDIAPGKYCRYCYRLELQGNMPRNEMMAYHVKYRHGKESRDDDFEDLAILAEEYGEREEDMDMFFSFLFPFL